jgi:hypothetical protein
MTVQTARIHALALATQLAGFLIAFIPSFAPDKQILISVGGVVGSVAILIAHAVLNRPVAVSASSATVNEVRAVLDTVDFNSIVRAELTHIVAAPAAPKFDPATGAPIRGAHA